MSTTTRRSYDDQILAALEEWRQQHPEETHWDNDEVAQWMIDEKRFGVEQPIVRKELAKKLAKAANRRRVRNPQGRRVREYHAAKLPVRTKSGKLVQKTFWAHRSEMEASFAHASMDQRQRQAEGFCRSMYNDAQDLNDNNNNLEGNPIQLELDFRHVSGEKRKQEIQIIPTDVPHDRQRLSKKKPH